MTGDELTQPTGKIDQWANGLSRAFKTIASIKVLTAFRVMIFLMLLVLVIFAANVAMNKSTVEKLVEKALVENQESKIDMDIREMVSPKIQRCLINMIYTLDCDRAFVIELHNGQKNATELPFKFFDMTYEEVNDERNVRYISQYFFNTMVTHYKFPYYLSKNGQFVGTADELYEVDSRFADNFVEHNGNYLAIVALRSGRDEIGFLGIAYNDSTNVQPRDAIIREIDNKAKVIRDLLDLGFQKQNVAYDNQGRIIEN